jgi:hypothetical protein
MPRLGRDRSETTISTRHAGDRVRSKTGTVQLLAQSPQNVQAPLAEIHFRQPAGTETQNLLRTSGDAGLALRAVIGQR